MKTSAPVNFVYESDFDEEKARAANSIDDLVRDDPDIALCMNGSRADLNMIVLTYFYLREAGIENIRLSRSPAPDCINVIHSDQLVRQPVDPALFLVCVEGEFPRRLRAHFRILQNRDHLGPHSACIWLWPHPGLIPHDGVPKAIHRIGYLGQTYNGNLAWPEERWIELLAPLGVEFVARPPSEWHDFSTLDAAIAIRSFGKAPHSKKPPSKLVNAWIAGVPFIGGADSAYVQVGTPGVDFLLATSPEEVRDCVAQLRDDPGLVRCLVANGSAKAQGFTKQAIMELWLGALEGPVEQRYTAWRAHPRREGLRSRLLGAADVALASARRRVRESLASVARRG